MIVREMVLEDLPELIELQGAGAVIGMAAVLPRDRYPFPDLTHHHRQGSAHTNTR